MLIPQVVVLLSFLTFTHGEVKPKTTVVSTGSLTLRLFSQDTSDGSTGADVEDKPVEYQVAVSGKTVHKGTLKGKSGWEPWGISHTRKMNLVGDSTPDILIEAYSNHGGSGTMHYLYLLDGNSKNGHVRFIASTASENIHGGEFLLAREGVTTGVIVTRPLMDNETRPEPTHWQVTAIALRKRGPAQITSRRTSKRYTETVPLKDVLRYVPKGWKLVK
jgi:hypothetical protein